MALRRPHLRFNQEDIKACLFNVRTLLRIVFKNINNFNFDVILKLLLFF